MIQDLRLLHIPFLERKPITQAIVFAKVIENALFTN